MKYTIGLLLMLLPAFAIAQTKAPIDSLARVTLSNLLDSWTLGIDSTSEVVDIKTYNKFKNLFEADATVDDDLDVFYHYDPKKNEGSYRINASDQTKTFDLYAHDVVLHLKSIIIDSVETLESKTSNQNNITFLLKRMVKFEKPRQYVIPNTLAEELISSRAIEFENNRDSLRMAAGLKSNINKNPEEVFMFTSVSNLLISMAFNNDTVRITSIKNISSEVICTNDADHDAILDQEDSLNNKAGDFTANGMPDSDLDGIPNGKDKCKLTYGYSQNQGCPISYFFNKSEIDGFVGLQLSSATIKLPGLAQLGYVDGSGNSLVDESLSRDATLKSPGRISGIYGGGNYTWYFGQKRKQVGISVGFNYAAITAKYQSTVPGIYTFKSSDGTNFYRRRIKDSLNETIKYNVFNFPLLFNYRVHIDHKNKTVLNLKVGPSLMFFNNTSDYNATIDFGGIYQTANGKIVYDDRFDPASTFNIYFTSDKINAQSPNPGADNVFDQLRSKGYDFANNKNYSGSQHLQRITVGFNLDANFQYEISERWALKGGPHLLYAPFFKSKEKYQPIDRTTDQYQSIYNGNTTSGYAAFGVNAGLMYSF